MVEKRKYADRKEELIKAVAKRRRKIKLMAIEYKGGKCQICGYNKYPGALDLHHINSMAKNHLALLTKDTQDLGKGQKKN